MSLPVAPRDGPSLSAQGLGPNYRRLGAARAARLNPGEGRRPLARRVKHRPGPPARADRDQARSL